MKTKLRNIKHKIKYRDVFMSQYLITCLNTLHMMEKNGNDLDSFVTESLNVLPGLKSESKIIYMKELFKVVSKHK